MAEIAAHITTTAGSGDDAPSIFEVLAQESLMLSLRPALSYTCKILASHDPMHLGFLHRYSHEVFLFIDLILHTHYLKNHSSSFAENFYSLKRIPLKCDDKSYLSKKIRLKSILFLVVLPYLKHRIDEWHKVQEDQHTHRVPQCLRERMYKLFMVWYPRVQGMCLSINFVLTLLYILGRSRYHNICLPLSGVQLSNMTPADIFNSTNIATKTITHTSILGRIYTTFSQGVSTAAVGISSGLSGAVFFLQFLEWWYASDHSSKSLTSLPIVPPPKVIQASNLPALSSVCPICHRVRTNDTALSSTGYVFCYPCIFKYVTKHKQCPVTGYPAQLSHLVRLFQPDS